MKIFITSRNFLVEGEKIYSEVVGENWTEKNKLHTLQQQTWKQRRINEYFSIRYIKWTTWEILNFDFYNIDVVL